MWTYKIVTDDATYFSTRGEFGYADAAWQAAWKRVGHCDLYRGPGSVLDVSVVRETA